MSTPSRKLERRRQHRLNRKSARRFIRDVEAHKAEQLKEQRVGQLREYLGKVEERASVIRAHYGALAPRDIFPSEGAAGAPGEGPEDAEAGESPEVDHGQLEHGAHGRPDGLDHGGPQQHDDHQEVDVADLEQGAE